MLPDLRFGPNTSQEIKKVDPNEYAPSLGPVPHIVTTKMVIN